MKSVVTIIVTVCVVLATLNSGASPNESVSQGPPYARSEALTEQRFGFTYTDPYRWMENADDAALYEWLSAEEAYTDVQTAGSLRDELADELRTIFGGAQVGLVSALDHSEERMVHRHRFRREKGLHEPDRFPRSSSSQRYQIILEPSNTDIQTVRVLDTQKGLFLEDTLRVKWFEAIWDADEQSFVYSSGRDGRLGGATHVVRRHRLGTSQTDDITLVEAKSGQEYIGMIHSDGETWLMHYGCPGNRLSLLDLSSGHEETLFETEKDLLGLFDFQKGTAWFVSFLHKDMGEVVAFDTVARKFTRIVAARHEPLDRVALIGNDLYLTYVRKGANELRRFDLGSKKMIPIDLPTPGQVLIQGADDNSGEMLFSLSTYTAEADLYAYNPTTGKLRLVWQGSRPDVELEAKRVYYTPVEGWTAPIWVVKRKDTPFSPDMPMYLYGYGGFRVNILPAFNPSYLPWFRRGGAVAVVTLPGGLEYGEAWHRLGMGENKRNVFDAFARAAKTLIAKGWTDRRRIAIGGASNGGLLAAATARFYPGLFRVTVPQVGVLDMTRFSLFTGGAQWSPEYGERDIAGVFHNLLSISPYHLLRKDRPYPATLVVTSDQDDRVVPAHSYKFVARLQAGSPGVRSLLHVAHGTGHNYYGAAPEENVRTASIIWSFIMQELGMDRTGME